MATEFSKTETMLMDRLIVPPTLQSRTGAMTLPDAVTVHTTATFAMITQSYFKVVRAVGLRD
jgi:hypothetical protein